MRSRFIFARFTYGFIAVLLFIVAVAGILALVPLRADRIGQSDAMFVMPVVCLILSYLSGRQWARWTKLSSEEPPQTLDAT